MNKPISAGDTCIIVRGLAHTKSPNVGKIVTVRERVYGEHGMDHSKYGPVVKVEGPEVYQMNDVGQFVNKGWADIPVDWLKRIEPPKLDENKELATTLESDEEA